MHKNATIWFNGWIKCIIVRNLVNSICLDYQKEDWEVTITMNTYFHGEQILGTKGLLNLVNRSPYCGLQPQVGSHHQQMGSWVQWDRFGPKGNVVCSWMCLDLLHKCHIQPLCRTVWWPPGEAFVEHVQTCWLYRGGCVDTSLAICCASIQLRNLNAEDPYLWAATSSTKHPLCWSW